MHTTITRHYSLDALADAAEGYGSSHCTLDGSWAGGTFEDALRVCRSGWSEQLDAALDISESAVSLMDQEHEVDRFEPVWDVSGAEVDVGRFVTGEPECMIDYPLTRISRVGKVITLCASVCYSAAIDTEEMIKRGQVITALALALSRLGHSVELWADFSIRRARYDDGPRATGTVRVLVKGANDALDPERILYAYAHPSMSRQLCFAACKAWPASFGNKMRGGSGIPEPPPRDLPEGTIYLPELKSGKNVPNADQFLRDTLRELGLLAES